MNHDHDMLKEKKLKVPLFFKKDHLNYHLKILFKRTHPFLFMERARSK